MHAPGPHERVQDPVDGVLHFLLPHHRSAALAFLRAGGRLVEGPVEELEAPHAPPRLLQRLGAVVVEAVADVLRRVARVHARGFEKRFHVLLESEDRLVGDEGAPDLIPDGLQVAERVHHGSVTP